MADVQLFCYADGDPGAPITMPRQWIEIPAREIADLSLPPGTLVIAHPGREETINLWLDWAFARRGDAAVLLVGSEPLQTEALRRDAIKRHGKDDKGEDKLWNTFVFSAPIKKRNQDPLASQKEWHERLKAFMGVVMDMSGGLSKTEVGAIWEGLSAVETEQQLKQKELYFRSACMVLETAAGQDEVRRYSNLFSETPRFGSHSHMDFLDLESRVGERSYPYAVARVEVRHTLLGHGVLFVLESESGTPASREAMLRDGVWPKARDAIRALLDRAPIAHTASLSHRAAMYLADPCGAPPTIERLIAPHMGNPDVSAAAKKLVAELQAAKIPADIEGTLTKLRGVVAEADAEISTNGASDKFKALAEQAHELLDALKIKFGASG